MERLIARALRPWGQPLPEDDAAALGAFRAVDDDPVQVNGTATPLSVLVDIFVIDEQRDRVTAIGAQADYLSLLIAAGAVSRLGA